MPRWLATYPAGAGFTTLSLISSIGAGIIGLAMTVFAYNLWISARVRVPAPPDPWGGQTLEWATSSPPPRFNFSLEYPVPPVRSYAPLLDPRPKQQAGPGAVLLIAALILEISARRHGPDGEVHRHHGQQQQEAAHPRQPPPERLRADDRQEEQVPGHQVGGVHGLVGQHEVHQRRQVRHGRP